MFGRAPSPLGVWMGWVQGAASTGAAWKECWSSSGIVDPGAGCVPGLLLGDKGADVPAVTTTCALGLKCFYLCANFAQKNRASL